eukprot:TRINITY_DN1669_c0_g1_i20.p1 TRINITY_DN1669_c0_g1~~TRINITY_DN1669_c0_g1_i20.p1  ORF type:complete len:235 (+),score=17.72 TRINITY_DN1669_c0_g1_i20:529-1233(+)
MRTAWVAWGSAGWALLSNGSGFIKPSAFTASCYALGQPHRDPQTSCPVTERYVRALLTPKNICAPWKSPICIPHADGLPANFLSVCEKVIKEIDDDSTQQNVRSNSDTGLTKNVTFLRFQTSHRYHGADAASRILIQAVSPTASGRAEQVLAEIEETQEEQGEGEGGETKAQETGASHRIPTTYGCWMSGEGVREALEKVGEKVKEKKDKKEKCEKRAAEELERVRPVLELQCF